MILPLVSNIVPGGMNALYQQMLHNQILSAQAKYSQPLAQAKAQSAQGAAQTALAQGQAAPQYFGGQAAQATGAGQTALAQGGIAVPLAQAQLTQQNALAKYAQPLAKAGLLTAQLQPAATQAGINLTQASTAQTAAAAVNQQLINEYVPASEQAKIGAAGLAALAPVLHNMKLAFASPAAIQKVVNEMVASAAEINPKAPNVPLAGPAGYFKNTNSSATKLAGGGFATTTGRHWIRNSKFAASSPQGWSLVQ